MQAQSVETVTSAAAESAAALETNFGNEQPVVTVPYSSLQRSPLNVRTKPPSGIAGLAANVRAKGLLQNLVVHEIKGVRGRHRKYGVCAGQRREAALDLLFEQKHIAADYPVPVRIVSEGEALAISLIENSEREGLDPFDVLRAYRMLADEGRSVDYIAALFSASSITVKRRMKLANVSPKLLALLREDAITLDQLAALALADDHDTQEHLWFQANEWQRQPHYLRQAITRAEIDASRSRLVRFVGLVAYEAAGGYVRRDLFSDDEHAGYIADADLLQNLAAQKLDAAAETLRAEGWGWTETRVERDMLELNRYGRLRPVHRPYSDEEQRELDALTAQQTELSNNLDALTEDDDDAYDAAERLDTEIGQVEAAIRALETSTIVWDASQMAEAGASVIVGPQGELVIERGLVRREGSATLDAAGGTVTGTPIAEAPDTADAPAKVKPIHSATLCQRLTAHRTAAVHAELIAQPTVAIAALLQHLIPQAVPEHYGHASATRYLALSGNNNRDSLLRAADDLPVSPAWNTIETQRTRWIAELPASQADLLPWLLRQDAYTTLLDLLAFCTGNLLDGIATSEEPHAINALADALSLDMARYWTPTRTAYFDHVSKARVAEVVSGAVSPKVAADLAKMKKGDAAAAAELRLAKVAWLPEILIDREIPASPSWAIHGDDEDDDDGEDVDADENGGNDDNPVNHTSHDAEPSTGTAEQPPWPFPTTESVTAAQTDPDVV
ncbi:TPA: ParB N-terminal domain-containing protein [Burkholderia aenigmatica]|uniref:ParB/RepB/Spo0J family partition protein n=1 Tax=Burkholderia sp. AU45251 TaxID=3059204 RepID=UPI00264AC229|nr:ParB/Srx family N-terminal domain-containing protein [Burkholderia sp. AU45251]HDR9483092.1 ParB N-terminal domain-containing protein [Burkholderia aenigmatica]MDN7515956.1 ParB/Srx family N-terminal domain-containing protein [Burkholderia sp. AU45251]HDR9514040.1 ParB N-terminal domain-containing protein [Burkholderia aenigmatica]HDR9591430.1 ParB N-terminal domain-containing protein [Burkholderia aenigmatica]HDR9598522.1 ParB N-terminal domain-containing protein [Burkholderia aenigmatica]